METKRKKVNEIPYCPNCAAKLDAATGVTEQVGPKKGDVSVCFYCAVPLRFDRDLLLRRITQKEFNKFPEDVIFTLKEIQKNILEFIEKKKSKGIEEKKNV